MASSLQSQPSSISGLTGLPAGEWPGAPAMEMDTILRTPRGDVAEPVASVPQYPSFWRQLFPVMGEIPAADQTADPAFGVSLGHFTIEKRIGAGAMGAVFLAFDNRLQRHVALKILAPAQATDLNTIQRFQNEAQAAARLDHEHVARVFYYGEERGLHFIAYEFVSGTNLRDLLRQRGRLSPAEAVNYGIQIATALRHISRHGVIHRDIKPSNIIVTNTGRAKLVDLGLAKRDGTEPGGELTVAGTTLGTFDYISPEQARDPRAVDVRSDIYSLGCTLYHLLTGVPPYPEGTVLQKLLDHQAHETPDVTTKNRRVSPAFSAVIRKMMSSDVKRRYASPEELLRDLALIARSLGLRVMSSDAAMLVPESRLRGTWWDRNFGWALTASALLLVVAALQLAPEFVQRMTNWSAGLGWTLPDARIQPAMSSRSFPDGPPVNASKTPLPSEIDRILDPEAEASPPVPRNDTDEMRDSPDEEEIVANDPSPEAVNPPATTAPADKLPAISIVGSRTSYSSLDQACSEAKDGEIIELRYDGSRSLPEQPMRLANKRLVIRGAKGFRPTIEFSERTGSSDQVVNRAVAVTGGSLQLLDLDIVVQVGASPTAAAWSLFSLERPEQLKLDGVTVTVMNPKRRAATLIEHSLSPSSSTSGMLKPGVPAPPTEIHLSGCVLRGAAALLTIRDAIPARCSIEGSLIALDDSLLHIAGRASMNPGDNGQLRLEVSHTTAFLGNSLILAQPEDEAADQQLPIFVVAQNNLIAVGREHAMVDLVGGDAMEVRRTFAWSGERNLYNDIKSFWTIRSRQTVTPTPFDFFAWREYWGSDVSASANTPIRWLGDFKTIALQDVTLEDFSLVTSGGPNPAIKAAADGTDLGAPLDKLPAPPVIATGK